jgi:hypothetical protein
MGAECDAASHCTESTPQADAAQGASLPTPPSATPLFEFQASRRVLRHSLELEERRARTLLKLMALHVLASCVSITTVLWGAVARMHDGVAATECLPVIAVVCFWVVSAVVLRRSYSSGLLRSRDLQKRLIEVEADRVALSAVLACGGTREAMKFMREWLIVRGGSSEALGDVRIRSYVRVRNKPPVKTASAGASQKPPGVRSTRKPCSSGEIIQIGAYLRRHPPVDAPTQC